MHLDRFVCIMCTTAFTIFILRDEFHILIKKKSRSFYIPLRVLFVNALQCWWLFLFIPHGSIMYQISWLCIDRLQSMFYFPSHQSSCSPHILCQVRFHLYTRILQYADIFGTQVHKVFRRADDRRVDERAQKANIKKRFEEPETLFDK